MHPFTRQYCGWLEELAEAQRRCEAVAESLLEVEEVGKPVTADLNERYISVHRALGQVVNRFPTHPSL